MKSLQKSLVVIIVLGLMLYIDHSLAAPSRSMNLIFDSQEVGPIYFNVFKSEEGFPEDSDKATQSGVVPKGESEYSFLLMDDVDSTFALAAFMDLNGNEKLDTNSLGVPLEPVAFSSNPLLVFSAPSYAESLIDYNKKKSVTLRFKTF